MDVVICNFPPMLPWYLPAAPAVLLGACKWLGLSASFIDFNVEKYAGADQVLDFNPKVVALSVFSYKSRDHALILAKEIKAKNPNVQIIIGGSGTSDALNGELQESIKENIDAGIINFYIKGDGEHKFPALLAKIFNLPDIPEFDFAHAPYFPDYSLYKIELYNQHAVEDKLSIPVTGSRGCVRNCTFCDIPARWDFLQKDPNTIAAEIRKILSTANLDQVHIHFTDSLVNGSLPTFYKLLDLLIDIKSEYPEFTWGGQFIIRRKVQSSDEYWKRISLSGARSLEVGVETGSDRLRLEMKKYFSNVDLRHSVELMEKYGVTCTFLMFTGSPAETEQDFEQTINLLTELASYNKNVITSIELGYLTTINPKTPLIEASSQDPNMILTKNPIIWFNKNNPQLTFLERINRRKRFETHARSLGYSVGWDTHIQVQEAEQSYQDFLPIIKLIERQK